MTRSSSLPSHYRQKRRPIGLQLPCPDAGDFAHRAHRLGFEQGHLAQDGIVEYDIGGHARFLRQIAAEGAERLEQRIAQGVGRAAFAP